MASVYQFGLLGYPVGHSLSPLLHRAALQAAGLDGNYCLYSIPPDQDDLDVHLRNLLGRVLSGEISGLNVTIPYKQKVIAYLDLLTPVATQIEAVNTIFLENGHLVGDNTDVPGFLVDVTTRVSRIDEYAGSKTGSLPDMALILGAGGSARAIVYALASMGKHIILMSRQLEQAQRIIVSLKKKAPRVFQSEPLPATLTPSNLDKVIAKLLDHDMLIVNTTPVGMWPDVNSSPWPESVRFPARAGVYDLIYNPRETVLMKQAMHAGLPAWNGLGMLIEQAALSFTRWTGIVSAGPAMWQAVNDFDSVQNPVDI